MATVKLKFRASANPDKEGTLFFQVIHGRIARQIHTGYKLYAHEWDSVHSEILLPDDDTLRREYLLSLKMSLAADDSL